MSLGLWHRRAVLLGVLFAWWVGIPALGSADDNPYSALPARYGEAVVTLRYLEKINMPGIDQEIDREVRCLMIDASGVVLCSSSEIGGLLKVMARLLGQSEQPISTRARDLKASVEGHEQEWPARLIARDSDRDLAWVMLEDVPEDVRFKFVDFAQAAAPEIGDQIYLLRRLDPFFGDETVVSDFSIAARLKRPRPLFLASRSLGYLGMPAFDRQQRVVGVFVAQVPAPGAGRPVMQRQTLPGQPGPVDDMVGRLILPASEVVKATRLAKETWQADQDESLP